MRIRRLLAIPPVVPGRDIDPTGKYVCPLCNVQRTTEPTDTGWVECPMIQNRMICLGSCIDHQGAALSFDFDTHYDAQLFYILAQSTDDDVSHLRWICLCHQVQVIDDQLQVERDDVAELIKLRERVRRAIDLLDKRADPAATP